MPGVLTSILIVSPYDETCASLASMLLDRGVGSVQAQLASQAMVIASQSIPSLVFLEITHDIDAEGHSAESFVISLNALPKRPVIVFMSAMDSKADRAFVERLDGYVYVVRPVGVSTLDTILGHFG